MKKIILASASPRRKELLEQIGLEFEIITSDQEEHYQNTIPEEIVKELALMKAEHVASEIGAKDLLVIGADTIVVLDGEILGKPEDEEDAFSMLNRLRGRVHQVFTGVALLDYDRKGKKEIRNFSVETKVYVCEMQKQEIWDYVRTGEPMDKAGAYGIQGKFAAFINRIEGDYYNVVGLPISKIYQEIK